MIKCDKCGFGHKTLEELAACKSWEEMQAPKEPLCADCGKPNIGHDYLHSTHPFRKGDS